MASNSSDKIIDHGNYVPTPVPSRPVAASGLRPYSAAAKREWTQPWPDAATAAPEAVFVDEGEFKEVYLQTPVPANFVVGAGAKLDVTIVVLPGITANIPVTVDITGPEAEVNLKGLYLCSGTDEVTFDVTVHHRVQGCVSHQLFNGLASGSAKCAFFGKIIVAPDAQRTEAYQENHNIVLSDQAKVNTKPQLEIYADDVRCSHGATVGKLNEDEQFYMRSRGIPEGEARVLQMISFVAPVLDGLEDEGLATRIEAAIRSLADR